MRPDSMSVVSIDAETGEADISGLPRDRVSFLGGFHQSPARGFTLRDSLFARTASKVTAQVEDPASGQWSTHRRRTHDRNCRIVERAEAVRNSI